MEPARLTRKLFHATFAAVFGFMSLAHGPVMAASAPANAPTAQTVPVALPMAHAHHHPGAQHGAMDMMADPAMTEPAVPETTPACFSFACFLAISSLDVSTPAALLAPLAKLGPHLQRNGSPATPELIEPPPRLQD